MTTRWVGIALLLPAGLTAQAPASGRLAGTARGVNLLVEGAVAYAVPTTPGTIPPFPDTVVVDQRDLTFVPRVTIVQPGTTVAFDNSDEVLHNVFSPNVPPFNLGLYPRTTSRRHRFDLPGAYVILCHIHPEMVAYVIVVPTPYHAVVDTAGHFTINDLPPGEYQLHLWHWRSAEVVRHVRIMGDQETRLEVELRRAPRGASRPGKAR